MRAMKRAAKRATRCNQEVGNKKQKTKQKNKKHEEVPLGDFSRVLCNVIKKTTHDKAKYPGRDTINAKNDFQLRAKTQKNALCCRCVIKLKHFRLRRHRYSNQAYNHSSKHQAISSWHRLLLTSISTSGNVCHKFARIIPTGEHAYISKPSYVCMSQPSPRLSSNFRRKPRGTMCCGLV